MVYQTLRAGKTMVIISAATSCGRGQGSVHVSTYAVNTLCAALVMPNSLPQSLSIFRARLTG